MKIDSLFYHEWITKILSRLRNLDNNMLRINLYQMQIRVQDFMIQAH